MLYELHVSHYVFLAIILQDCVSEIFPVYGRSRCPALHDTLAACGCRDSLELASGLHAKLLITHPGCCGMSPDISLTGHFTIPNNVVGEMQKGGVKTFGNPDTRETWNTHTCFKLLLPRIQVLPSFFFPRIFPYFMVLLTSWTHQPQMTMRITNPVLNFPVLFSSSCPKSHNLHFKDHFDKPGFASPSFLAPV